MLGSAGRVSSEQEAASDFEARHSDPAGQARMMNASAKIFLRNRSLAAMRRGFGVLSGSAAVCAQEHHNIRSLRDSQGTPKNLCEEAFAELSGELSGAICLRTLAFIG